MHQIYHKEVSTKGFYDLFNLESINIPLTVTDHL